MTYLFRNNASTTLSGNITSASGTLTVTSAVGFPIPGAGESFRIAIQDDTGVLEFCSVTAVSGLIFTLVRGVDGTSAQDFSAGAVVELRLSRDEVNNFAQLDGAYFSGDVSVAGTTTLSGTPRIGGSQIWHEGNDGHGNGLDADTVDTQQASEFALATHDHDLDYAAIDHNHDADYAAIDHGHPTLELGDQTDTTLSRKTNEIMAVENQTVFTQSDTNLTSGLVTFSELAPSGGNNGDLWFKYEPLTGVIMPNISTLDTTNVTDRDYIESIILFNYPNEDGDFQTYASNRYFLNPPDSLITGRWHAESLYTPEFPNAGGDFVYRWRDEVVTDTGPGAGQAGRVPPQSINVWGPMTSTFSFYAVIAAPSANAVFYSWSFLMDIAENDGNDQPLGGEAGILKTIGIQLSLEVTDP